MPMREDFCAFILTHGRPDRVHTYKTLMKAGYTGKVFIVIDDEDKTADEYRKRFGDKVLQFCKQEVAERIDEGDNFNDRRTIVYARNACWDLARQVRCKYFIQLDDDYTDFQFYFDKTGAPKYQLVKTTCDQIFTLLLEYYLSIPALTIAMSQGGDFLGGFREGNKQRLCRLRRKAMNTFICTIDRPFYFFGRINEDVNTYVTRSRCGDLFFTVMQAKITQIQTQQNKGGMSDIYLDSGTYVKSFYTVMYSPSCCQVGLMGDPRSSVKRLHHKINWNVTVPKILREEWKRSYAPQA